MILNQQMVEMKCLLQQKNYNYFGYSVHLNVQNALWVFKCVYYRRDTFDFLVFGMHWRLKFGQFLNSDIVNNKYNLNISQNN